MATMAAPPAAPPAASRRLRALSSQLRQPSTVATRPAAAAPATEDERVSTLLPRGRQLDWRTQGLIDAGLSLEDVRAAFERDGYCIVKNVVGEDERLNVQYELAELVEREAERIGRAGAFADAPFETRLLQLFADRLEDAPEIFRENTHLPGFYCLFYHPAIIDLVSFLLHCDELRIYPNYGCRPKLPAKHRDEVLWHSDAGYTYFGPAADPDKPDSRDEGELTIENVERMAQTMINVWTPLVPVAPYNGCMQFSRGSHKLGLVKHEYRRDLGQDTREGHWLHIDEDVLQSHCSPEGDRVVDIAMNPGDIVLFHQHMLHSSQHPNQSDQVRWALDFRYQDARESTLRVTQGHLVRSALHPERVIRNAEQWAESTFS